MTRTGGLFRQTLWRNPGICFARVIGLNGNSRGDFRSDVEEPGSWYSVSQKNPQGANKFVRQEEIRGEIERRRQRAKDLKLRELVWDLFHSNLQHHSSSLDKEIIFPAIRETLVVANHCYRFSVGERRYELVYKPAREHKDRCGTRLHEDEVVTTPIEFTLLVDEKPVFAFEMRRTVQYSREMPVFSEYMGEVTAFIGGTWVQDFIAMVAMVNQHKRAVWDRNATVGRDERLKEEMKKFGL
jgi:hypothetical protein